MDQQGAGGAAPDPEGPHHADVLQNKNPDTMLIAYQAGKSCIIAQWKKYLFWLGVTAKYSEIFSISLQLMYFLKCQTLTQTKNINGTWSSLLTKYWAFLCFWLCFSQKTR